jgi:hypothetical protein
LAKVPVLEECLENIKQTFWKWLVEKKKGGICIFYEWNIDPMNCIFR